MSTGRTFVEGIGRNPGEDAGHHHLYEEMPDGDLKPLCRWGWNRSNGEGFSIFRGHGGARGLCLVCRRRRAQNLPSVDAKPNSHKTKWL